MITSDNWKDITCDNIQRKSIPEAEVKALLRLPAEVNKNITRIRNGTKGGNRLILLNDVVYFLNNINRSVAATLLDFLVSDENKPAMNSIMSATGIQRYPMDLNLYEDLKKDLQR